jgi:hypothetical protein
MTTATIIDGMRPDAGRLGAFGGGFAGGGSGSGPGGAVTPGAGANSVRVPGVAMSIWIPVAGFAQQLQRRCKGRSPAAHSAQGVLGAWRDHPLHLVRPGR